MFFSRNNDIDDDDYNEISENKTFNMSKYMIPLIIFGGFLIVVIIIAIVASLFKKEEVVYEEKLYYITLLGETDMTLYLHENYNEPGYSGKDDSGADLTSEIVITNNIDNNRVGSYKVSYTLGNITKERNVRVIEKPVGATYIHLLGDKNVFLYIGEEYIEKGYKVIDSIDGDKLNDKVKVASNVDTSKEGIYKVIYSVVNSSKVTTSQERTVVVMDRSISLIPVETNTINGNVTINIYIKDELFDYLILPNNTKVTERTSTYQVSNNGEYKFVMYNTEGSSLEKKITINNIDKEVPSGSCSGSYQEGTSQINISATDNVGISKYVINDVTYTSNVIKLDKEVDSVNITIYDKAGNTKGISCKLENKNPPKSSSVPSSSSSSSSPASSSKVYSDIVVKLGNKDLCEKTYVVTADDLNKLFINWSKKTGNTNSPLLGTGASWIKACNATGLDPMTLVAISGLETGRGGFRAMPWMEKKNFFGMKYIDPTGDGTGRSVLWAGDNDVFNGNVDLAVMQSAKRLKNFYYKTVGAHSLIELARKGYAGKKDEEGAKAYAYSCSSIMNESIEYIKSLHK